MCKLIQSRQISTNENQRRTQFHIFHYNPTQRIKCEDFHFQIDEPNKHFEEDSHDKQHSMQHRHEWTRRLHGWNWIQFEVQITFNLWDWLHGICVSIFNEMQTIHVSGFIFNRQIMNDEVIWFEHDNDIWSESQEKKFETQQRSNDMSTIKNFKFSHEICLIHNRTINDWFSQINRWTWTFQISSWKRKHDHLMISKIISKNINLDIDTKNRKAPNERCFFLISIFWFCFVEICNKFFIGSFFFFSNQHFQISFQWLFISCTPSSKNKLCWSWILNSIWQSCCSNFLIVEKYFHISRTISWISQTNPSVQSWCNVWFYT